MCVVTVRTVTGIWWKDNLKWLQALKKSLQSFPTKKFEKVNIHCQITHVGFKSTTFVILEHGQIHGPAYPQIRICAYGYDHHAPLTSKRQVSALAVFVYNKGIKGKISYMTV